MAAATPSRSRRRSLGGLGQCGPCGAEGGVDLAEVHQAQLVRVTAAAWAAVVGPGRPHRRTRPLRRRCLPTRTRHAAGTSRSRPPERRDLLILTGVVTTSASPEGTHVPSSTLTPGVGQLDGEQSSLIVADPRRHQGVADRTGERAPWLASSQRPRPPSPRAMSRAPGPSAAQTPHVEAGEGSCPSSARMATASRCGSRTRATVRSCAATVASSSHRSPVAPLPGSAASGRSDRPRNTSATSAPTSARAGGATSASRRVLPVGR